MKKGMVSSKDDSASDGENSSGDCPESDSALFSEGEKVLAYHGPKIYEAKVCLKNPKLVYSQDSVLTQATEFFSDLSISHCLLQS